MAVDVVLEASAEKQYHKAPRPVQAKLRELARQLADDPQFGEYVPIADVHNKATIKKWEARVGRVRNLYKLELPGAWRALYVLGSRGPGRIAMVLEVVDHKQYERVMGY